MRRVVSGRLRRCEAVVCLASSWLIKRLLHVRGGRSLVGVASVSGASRPVGRPTRVELEVARALHWADRAVPWATTCLDRAIAGKLMLRRRRVRARLVIGIGTEDPTTSHAWLVSSSGWIVVGGEEVDRFRAVTDFY